MTNEAKRKLTKLANFLETKVKPKWFDLNSWAERGFQQKECGTTACAVGWATVAFKGEGLTLGIYDNIMYEGSEGFEAAAKFFDVDESSASYLFDPEEYPLTRQSRVWVIRRIRQVVKSEMHAPTGLNKLNGAKSPVEVKAWSQV